MTKETAPDKHALSDSNFITQFEQLTLAPQHFDHLGHIRLAWLYLSHSDIETATQKVCSGIKAYAESLGARDKFHFTITYHLVRLIAARQSKAPCANWLEFSEVNQDITKGALALLLQHFSREHLFSEKAKWELVAPDLIAF